MKILIIDSKIGQLGNTLLVSAHLLAFSIEYGCVLINIPFDEYAYLFPQFKYNLLCSYPLSVCIPMPHHLMRRFLVRGRMSYLVKHIYRFLCSHFPYFFKRQAYPVKLDWTQTLDLDFSFYSHIKEYIFIVLTGWNFRSKQLVSKHGNSIELQNCDGFSSQKIFYGLGDPISDLYSLACCDYIVGPPSTFSLWASFYGQKPLYHIHDIRVKPRLENFCVESGLDWTL